MAKCKISFDHFTKEQVEELSVQLAALSKRDTDFPDAVELTGDERLAIVQDGANVLASMDDISDIVADKLEPIIPTEETVAEWGFTKNEGTYIKPDDGIPKSDLSSQVQESLNRADTAYQKPESGIPESHLSQDVRDKLNREGATVLSGTTDYWNSRTGFVPDANTIIIYTDKAIIDGENVPGIKIGSGNGYVQDLAFVGDDTADTLLDHINNNNIHITALERTSWTHKIDIDETGGEIRNETIRFIR